MMLYYTLHLVKSNMKLAAVMGLELPESLMIT